MDLNAIDNCLRFSKIIFDKKELINKLLNFKELNFNKQKEKLYLFNFDK